VLRKSPLVAQKTRESVLEAVESLGYVYNRGAANLRTQRSHTIGVAINELANPYFAELTAATQRAFSDLGRTVFIANAEEDPVRQDSSSPPCGSTMSTGWRSAPRRERSCGG
jgi:LacI family transcriptional regulator